MGTKITKGFIKDWQGNKLLPITRAELVLDVNGQIALQSAEFLAGNGHAGLVTAAERAMLQGGEGQNITDIYTKLGHINSGLKVGDTVLHFYDTTAGTSTPIAVQGGEGIVVTTAENKLIPALATVEGAAKTITGGIVRDITVDAYGRVTSVASGALLDADIPTVLTGKELTNCTVTAAPTADLGIANKLYVDQKVDAATTIATGALKFAGAINSETELTNAWTNKAKLVNSYFKVTASDLVLDVAKLQYSTKQEGTITLKSGDTLIVYKPENSTNDADIKFVYIPSADDITSLTVYGKGAAQLSNAIGSVGLSFSNVFNVSGDAKTNVATVTLPQAAIDADGYLSAADYKQFVEYETSLAVSYTPTITEATTGHYTIGTLTIGGTPTPVYGKNNIADLSLADGADTTSPNLNPRLKFTETDLASDRYITIQGGTGVVATKKDANTIELKTALTTDHETYLSVSDNKVNVVLGNFTTENEDGYTNGLVSFERLVAGMNLVRQSSVEVIETSLDPAKADEGIYKYGATLAAAVALTNL